MKSERSGQDRYSYISDGRRPGSSRAEPCARAGSSVKKLRVGVIYGGRSGEHEVSVASAAAVFKYLDRDRATSPSPIRIEKDGRWRLPIGRRRPWRPRK